MILKTERLILVFKRANHLFELGASITGFYKIEAMKMYLSKIDWQFTVITWASPKTSILITPWLLK